MAFSFKQSGTTPDATTTTITLSGVIAGNLIVAWAKWEGASGGTGMVRVTDGTSDFTLGPLTDNGTDMHAQFAYLLSANNGTRTYTFNINGVKTFMAIEIVEFSNPQALAVFDTRAIATGSGVALSSGNITLGTGSGLVVCVGAVYASAIFSVRNINNTAATDFIDAWAYSTLCYSMLDSGTMDGDITSDLSDLWVCGIFSFKSVPLTPINPIIDKVISTNLRPKPFAPGVAR